MLESESPTLPLLPLFLEPPTTNCSPAQACPVHFLRAECMSWARCISKASKQESQGDSTAEATGALALDHKRAGVLAYEADKYDPETSIKLLMFFLLIQAWWIFPPFIFCEMSPGK